jgi:hypothetical protein
VSTGEALSLIFGIGRCTQRVLLQMPSPWIHETLDREKARNEVVPREMSTAIWGG